MFREFIQTSSKTTKNTSKVISLNKEAMVDVDSEAAAQSRALDAAMMDRLELKARLHNKLLDTLNLSVLDKIEDEVLRREVGNLVTEGLREEGRALRGDALKELVDELMHEVKGLGPLEPLLSDSTVND
ncbi:MAG: CpaF family protein, partial [Roseobacter sp.]